MTTPLEKKRKERYEKTAKEHFKFIVLNKFKKNIVKSEYSTIEQVLHKIKLDLMTTCNYPELYDSTIEIKIKLNETKLFDQQHKRRKK